MFVVLALLVGFAAGFVLGLGVAHRVKSALASRIDA